VKKSCAYLDQFLGVIKPPTVGNSASNAGNVGGVEGSVGRGGGVRDVPQLGFGRLAVMKFLIMLLKLELSEVSALLLEKGMFDVGLEVMFTFRDNSVVQNMVLELFTVGMAQIHHAHDVILSTKLTKRIVESWEVLKAENELRLQDEALKEHALSWLKKLFKNFKTEPPFRVECAVTLQILKGSKTWSYFGHLFKVANLVVNVTTQVAGAPDELFKNESLQAMIKDENWIRFVEDCLKVYNAIGTQKLDPDYSSDSDSSPDENEDD